jgi:LmbE family N-acetylglucosaminyl deacetylase
MPLTESNRRILVIMPHPDDMEILCAGTLIRLREAGCEVHVATMTAGDQGSPNQPREVIAAIRRKEAGLGAGAIGAVSYTCLEFDDVRIVFDNDARVRTAAMLRTVNPALVVTTSPEDYMFDHVITSHLVRDACFNAPMPNYATPGGEEPTSSVPYLYYADTMEGHDILGRRLTPSCFVDISGQIEPKAKALACHDSQRAWLSKQHGMDDYIGAMKRWCARRGEEIGVAYAEAFTQHRGHPHPTDDVIAELLAAEAATAA